MTSCGGLSVFTLQQLHAELIAKFISLSQIFFGGFQAYTEAVYHTQVDLFQSFDDMRNAFTTPAIAAECGSQFAAVDGRIHTCCQIPDGFQCFLQNGRCTEEDTIGCADFPCHHACICGYQIVGFYVDIAGFFDTFCDFFCQLFCVAVSTYVRDHDCCFFICGHFAPCIIDRHQFRNVAIQYRAVTGTDQVDVQFTHALHGIYHVGLLEGAQNVVEIIFCGSQIAFIICYCAAQDTFMGIVRTKGVTSYQSFVFHYVCVHGIGPVQVGHY